jgi:hypothetical protein
MKSLEEKLNMRLTINKILKLTPEREDFCYGYDELPFFQPIIEIINTVQGTETEKQIIQKDYVKDFTNDCRSRQLSVLFYKNKPFALYQYIGKGYVENDVVFDREVYKEMVMDLMTEYFGIREIAEISRDQIVNIRNYDMGEFYIEENTLCSKKGE